MATVARHQTLHLPCRNTITIRIYIFFYEGKGHLKQSGTWKHYTSAPIERRFRHSKNWDWPLEYIVGGVHDMVRQGAEASDRGDDRHGWGDVYEGQCWVHLTYLSFVFCFHLLEAFLNAFPWDVNCVSTLRVMKSAWCHNPWQTKPAIF